jgi:hypothetical protein
MSEELYELPPALRAALEEDASYAKCVNCGLPHENHTAEDKCPQSMSHFLRDDPVLDYLDKLFGTSWASPATISR